MKLIGHQNIASSVITVTNTATAFYTLMNTAGSVTNSAAYFNDPNNGGPANGLIITPEDGDIRIDYNGLTPTASLGMLLSQGTKYKLPNIDLNQLQLIRVGGSNVAVSVTPASCHKDDGFEAVAESVAIEGTISSNPDSVQVDDAAFTPGTSSVDMVGATFDDTAPDSVDEGDGGALRMSANRNLYTTIRDAAGNERGVNVDASNQMAVADSAVDTNTTNLETAFTGDAGELLPSAVDSYTHVAINLTTGANQVLVSSAANKQVWVHGFAFTCGDADGQTVSLQDEDDTALTGVMEFAQYGGVAMAPSGNIACPLFKLGTDKDLEIDITGGDVDGFLVYSVVDVS